MCAAAIPKKRNVTLESKEKMSRGRSEEERRIRTIQKEQGRRAAGQMEREPGRRAARQAEKERSRRAERQMEKEQRRKIERRMKKRGYSRYPVRRRVLSPSNLLLAFIGFLFIFSFSVVLVLNLRTIYYFDIRYLQIEQTTGLTEETIRENYDALIDYNLITKHVRELEFPDFPMSEHGRIHFAEVKNIFVMIQILCMVSGVLLLVGLVKKLLRRDYGSLKLMSVMTFCIPTVLGVLAVWNWDAFFVRFHELFFDNDYWIFDPVTDPVITILPDAFFFHCAAAIILFLLLGCIITGALYRIATRKYVS